MADCDFCEAEFFMADRWVVALPRPSDPSELCAVMWACPACGPKHGCLSPKAIEEIELGITGEGPMVAGYEGIQFITV